MTTYRTENPQPVPAETGCAAALVTPVRPARPSARVPKAGYLRTFGTLLSLVTCLAAPVSARPTHPATASPTDSIRLMMVRFDGGAGPVVVSSGIPLPRGRLSPESVAYVHLFVGGAEQAVQVTDLGGRHPDGTVRSVLVRFRYDVPPSNRLQPDVFLVVDSQLRRDPAPATTEPVSYSLDRPLPDAALLPADRSELLSTDLVGPTVAVGDPFSRAYDANFERWGDPQWQAFLASYQRGLTADEAASHDYYDRALANYAWWLRTGNPEYWKRATYYVIGYRERYMRPNDYRVQPHNIQVEGLELHYLLTGDPESRRGVRLIAQYYATVWLPQLDSTTGRYLEARIQSRALDGLISAYVVGLDPDRYRDMAGQALDAILSSQRPNGSYTYRNLCDGQYNFMTGLLNDVLIRYYTELERDPRITSAVGKSLDFLWDTQWVGSAGGFKYASAPCPGKAGTAPSPDLNLLIVNGFGWYARQSGGEEYRQRGDIIFENGVRRAYLRGRKQFNENYALSYRYLYYRRLPAR